MILLSWLSKYKTILALLLIGVIFRFIYSFFFNHMIDYMNILALTRSITETDSLNGGFMAIKRLNHEAQLYGRIYYQISSVWLQILDRIGILHIALLFDTKPYSDPNTYLIGLGQWSPPLYQLTIIKLVQFFWDLPFVFFLYKLVQELGAKKPHYIVLFWALNPFFVMVGYGIFISDLAMVACLTGGIWLWVKALKTKSIATHFLGIGSVMLLALGAVIKLVPLLIIPFVIISLGKSFRSVFLLSGTTILSYLIFSQPWSPDSLLMKQHFLFSKESTTILNFSLNGIPIFLLVYILFFLLLFFKRKEVAAKHINAVFITSFIIILVYLLNSLNFIQFQIWLTPFVAIISLIFPKYSWLLLVNIFVCILRGIGSSDYFSILLSPTIGSGYSNNLSNPTLLKQFIKPEIFIYISDTIIAVAYLLSAFSIFNLLFDRKDSLNDLLPKEIKISFKKLVLLAFFGYFTCVVIDYSIKSRYILLPHKDYSYSSDLMYVTRKPFIISVTNPEGRGVHALDIMAVSKANVYNENTIFEFRHNNKLLYTQQVSDYEFPINSDNLFTLYLKKAIYEKQFDVHIYKNSTHNNIAFFKGDVVAKDDLNTPQNKLYEGYDAPLPHNILTLKFEGEAFPLYLRGSYGWSQIFEGLSEHFKTKPRLYFFTAYFMIVLSFILLLAMLYVSSFKNALQKIRRTTNRDLDSQL